MAAFRMGWRTLRHLNHRGYIYIWANILWLLLSLPLVTAPAAWAGLVKMSRKAQTGPTADLNDFWEGFRENLKRGLVVFILNVVIIGLNVFNLLSYSNQPGGFALGLRAVWFMTLFFWVMLQFYLWPLFYEMSEPNLRGAARNAALMIAFNPGFTLVLAGFISLVVVVSSVFPPLWILLTGGILAALASGAVLDRLVAVGVRKPLSDPFAIQPSDAGEGD
jgi:uncharacterized membrane protein YesL